MLLKVYTPHTSAPYSKIGFTIESNNEIFVLISRGFLSKILKRLLYALRAWSFKVFTAKLKEHV